MSLYPLLKDEAGSHAWSTMHHRASLYPDNPTDKEKERMKDFIYESMQSVALLCKNCKNHIRDYLKKNPLKPALESRDKLSQYLCTMHNSVNETQGKQTHDCTKILRPKEEAECKDNSCGHTKNIVQKDTTLDLRNTFEKFKEISTKVFHALCDKYKLPYPTIKFHECPSNPLNSCTSMWIDSQTQDIAERPVVYLHPNLFGLRSIVHEFMHYMKQLKKDTLGGLNEEEVERETQAIINHEFPFDEIDGKDTRAPVIAQTHLVRNDYVSRLREFPIASRIYDKHLVNIKRRDFRRGTNEEEQSESGDWVFDMLNKNNNNNIGNEQQQEQQGQGQQHIFSFMDGVYSPFASLLGMKASDLNKTNTPMLVSNAALAIIKSQMSPIGALLLSTATSLGIYGAMAFSRHSLSYGDKFLMNVFGSNFLFNSIDYVRPELKQDIVEGAMTLGNVVAAQQWDLIPHILLGDSLSSFLGETSTSTASPLSAARNLQRAAIGNRGASSGSLAGGRGNSNSNTIRSAAIDPKQQLADLRAIQREAAVTGPDNPLAVRAVKTGAGRGGNPADVIRARAQSQQSVGGSGVNSMPMYDPNSVMIPSDDAEVYESSFGMHVADGTGGASTRDDIDIGDRRNTVRDIFNTDPNYDNFNDVYYYSDEEVDMGGGYY